MKASKRKKRRDIRGLHARACGEERNKETDREKEANFPAWGKQTGRAKRRGPLRYNAIYERKGEARLSKKERRVDALALRAEERRDKLRKAAGRSTYPEIRRYLNGGTHMRKTHVSMHESIVHGREPGELKHLSNRRKRKKNRFPK